jgi:heme ABC exporter ATP-binding subunit CcmA
VRGAAIEARGLEKRFGQTRALAGIDLEVPAGQSLGLLGPNGAGKSTLLRLMAGLARPTAGALRIAGRPANEPAARAQVGLIGHATFLYPALTARENLQFAARLHRVADPVARADRLLAEGGLAGVAHRPVGGFSRGMAQRLSIARGLAHDPPVVLLDEPFTGLDRRAAERLAERLGDLRRDGRTVVLVTHDVARAAQLADTVAVLCRGRIAHRGPGGEENAATLEAAYLEATDAS